MSDLDALLDRAVRLAPIGEYKVWREMLEKAFTAAILFTEPMAMKKYCKNRNIDYKVMLQVAVISKNGSATVRVDSLTRMGHMADAYALAYACCTPKNGVKVNDVFPLLDEWGLES